MAYPAGVTEPTPDPTAEAAEPRVGGPAEPDPPSWSVEAGSSTGVFPTVGPAAAPPTGPADLPADDTPGYATYPAAYRGVGYGPELPWRDGPDDTIWALLAHLSYFAFLIVGPLVIMFTRARRSGFVRDQVVEALNLHISLAILAAVCIVLYLLIVPLIVLGVALLIGAVLAVFGAVAASRGEAYRYPLNLRLVR